MESYAVSAALDLGLLATEELHGSVALEKTGVVASSLQLARRISRRIKPAVGGTAALAMPNLGIDFGHGVPRRAHRFSGKRAQRYSLLRKRLARARRLKAAAGPGAAKIFFQGIRPATTYGAAVNGLSSAEQHKLRVALLSSRPPYARGSSLRAKLALYGDPTLAAAIAPILAYHRELWQAVTCPLEATMGLKELMQAWELTSCRSSPSWSTCTGPINACILSLHRLGWTMTGPLVMVDDWGRQVILIAHSPAMLQLMLQEASQRQCEKAFADKLGGAFVGRRVYMDHVKAMVTRRSARRQLPVVKPLAATLVCDGI